MRLKEFTCVACGTVDLLTGGNAEYRCAACIVVAGGFPFRTPQQIAHAEVARAIRRGDLAPAGAFMCMDCEAMASEYDHRDYLLPLVVQPVCRRCNLRRGPGANGWRKARETCGASRLPAEPAGQGA